MTGDTGVWGGLQGGLGSRGITHCLPELLRVQGKEKGVERSLAGFAQEGVLRQVVCFWGFVVGRFRGKRRDAGWLFGLVLGHEGKARLWCGRGTGGELKKKNRAAGGDRLTEMDVLLGKNARIGSGNRENEKKSGGNAWCLVVWAVVGGKGERSKRLVLVVVWNGDGVTKKKNRRRGWGGDGEWEEAGGGV